MIEMLVEKLPDKMLNERNHEYIRVHLLPKSLLTSDYLVLFCKIYFVDQLSVNKIDKNAWTRIIHPNLGK